MDEYRDQRLILQLMHNVSCNAIADAMREFADVRDDPAGHFECGECGCGQNYGDDDDCFACGEHDNLYGLTWVDGEVNADD